MRPHFVVALGFMVLAVPAALLTAGCGSGEQSESSSGRPTGGGGAATSSSDPGGGGQGGSTTSTGGAGGEGGAGGSMCVPSAESCDGLDNDCDGAIDNGDPGSGLTCDTGLPGACAAGTTACSDAVIVCNQNVLPSAEVCDGVDDDCDGTADNGDPGGNTSCFTSKPGACAAGTTTCQGGAVACVQGVLSSVETCNGVDDDCDGATDEENPCTGPGEICAAGICAPDCTAPGAVPCDPGSVCNVSDAQPGACVLSGGACIVTGPTVPCGLSQCGPGSSCNPATQTCTPDLPCTQVVCNGPDCHGTGCPCDRPPPLCAAATLAQLNSVSFVEAAVDLDFDRQCNGWAVSFLSGTDYLRKITPAGQVSTTGGVSNLNMGEVAVPHGQGGVFGGNLFDASLAYNCCSFCGCVGTPQGIGHYEGNALPIILSATVTAGSGPFGAANFDTGPTGLTYGLDGLLYAGNMVQNGDFHAIDTAAKTKTLVYTFPSRVHASAPFDGHRMLVALESKEIMMLELTNGTATSFATAAAFVTSMERDPFTGQIYVAQSGGAIRRLSAQGADLGLFATGQKSGRIALAPDNQLHFLNAGVVGAATIQVFPLPSSY